MQDFDFRPQFTHHSQNEDDDYHKAQEKWLAFSCIVYYTVHNL